MRTLEIFGPIIEFLYWLIVESVRVHALSFCPHQSGFLILAVELGSQIPPSALQQRDAAGPSLAKQFDKPVSIRLAHFLDRLKCNFVVRR
jgi:hypothetical protein